MNSRYNCIPTTIFRPGPPYDPLPRPGPYDPFPRPRPFDRPDIYW